MPVLIIVVLFHTPSVHGEIAALRNYRGDWMIQGDRKQLAATRLIDDGQSVRLRFSYQAIGGHVQKTWFMRYDAKTDQYSAKILGRTKETAVGEWDDKSKTMTWVIANPSDPGGPRAKPIGPRSISHAFADRTLHWTTTDVEPDGRIIEWLTLRWDMIVSHEAER